MLDLAIDEFLKDPAEAPFELMTVLDALADVAEAQKAGKFSQLSWQTLMTGAVAPEDEVLANRRILVLQPALDFKSLQPAAKALQLPALHPTSWRSKLLSIFLRLRCKSIR